MGLFFKKVMVLAKRIVHTILYQRFYSIEKGLQHEDQWQCQKEHLQGHLLPPDCSLNTSNTEKKGHFAIQSDANVVTSYTSLKKTTTTHTHTQKQTNKQNKTKQKTQNKINK